MAGCFFSLITISLTWVFYRPLIGLSLLAAADAISALLYMRPSTKASDENAEVPGSFQQPVNRAF